MASKGAGNRTRHASHQRKPEVHSGLESATWLRAESPAAPPLFARRDHPEAGDDADMRVLKAAMMAVALAVCAVAWTTAIRERNPRAVAHRIPPPVPPAIEAVTPASDATGVPVSVELAATVRQGKLTDVVLADAGGKRIAGALRDDGGAWVPSAALDYGTPYTAKVTVAGEPNALGERVTVTRQLRFTTMARPSRWLKSDLQLVNGATYGVAMPIVVNFGADVPVSARAEVQRRVFIKSEPPQPGAWRWFNAHEMVFRPRDYWQPGTKLSVRKAFNGLPIGGAYGDDDFAPTVYIGRKLVMDVDSATKQMTVSRDGTPLRTLPVSLGKPSTPTSTGTMVVMEKVASTIFDTTREGPGGYRVHVTHAQRLTYGGQFIHSAPWSVADQGVRNVSHGCLNLSPANAAWLYDQTLIGDPVTVRNTGDPLAPGDGWTAWDLSWQQFATT
jgi:lipoprotein-anchoring transpeptidase ErfK/SrfK